MLQRAFFQLLDSSLSKFVPRTAVACRGDWSTKIRKVYASPAQFGSGEGPFVDVVDAQWSGALEADVEFSVIAFLATSREIFWTKAPLLSTQLPVRVSLSACSASAVRGSTFTANVGNAFLPGVPVETDCSLEDVCNVRRYDVTGGQVAQLAKIPEAEILVTVLPRAVLKVGRNRLWRVRDEFALLLPAPLRELLTRRRTGTREGSNSK